MAFPIQEEGEGGRRERERGEWKAKQRQGRRKRKGAERGHNTVNRLGIVYVQ